MDKVAVFIDGGYLNQLSKHVFGSKKQPLRVNYEEVGLRIAKECGGDLFRTYYYHGKPFQSRPPTPEERQRKSAFDNFVAFMEKVDRMQLRLGRVRKYFDEKGHVKFEQKGVDVKLAIDALKLSLKNRLTRSHF